MHFSPELALSTVAIVCATSAAIFDIAQQRIPNLLTGSGVLLGLTLHALAGGWREFVHSFIALAICGLCFLLFHIAGGLGAGDVKLIAAQGCLLGLSNAAALLTLTAIAGGVLAIVHAGLHGRLRETFRNLLKLFSHHAARGLRPHTELNVRNSRTLRLPYAVAIAAGCMLTLYLDTARVHP